MVSRPTVRGIYTPRMQDMQENWASRLKDGNSLAAHLLGVVICFGVFLVASIPKKRLGISGIGDLCTIGLKEGA